MFAIIIIIVKKITTAVKNLDHVAEGNLTISMDKGLVQRKDEVGNIARNVLGSSPGPRVLSYRKAPTTPEIPPVYIIPGIPRLRFPDFSVSVSPIEP